MVLPPERASCEEAGWIFGVDGFQCLVCAERENKSVLRGGDGAARRVCANALWVAPWLLLFAICRDITYLFLFQIN